MKPETRTALIFSLVSISFVVLVFMMPFEQNIFINPDVMTPKWVTYIHYVCMIGVGGFLFFNKKMKHKSGGEVIGSLMLIAMSPLVIITFALVWLTIKIFPVKTIAKS